PPLSHTVSERSGRSAGRDLLLQGSERQRTQLEQPVVEVLEREGRTLSLGRLPPPSFDLVLPDLVREGLAGPRDVAVHLDLRLQPGHARLLHLRDGPVAVPA